jgi:23S rRNA (cytosine1962-C5)-methyltransferase
LISGQKTGFFLDQSENRLRVAEYARGKRVLDLFCYSGGFAIHCARAGAKEVIGVDSSVPAIQKAKQNAQLNEVPRTEFVESDAFDYLKEYSDEPFDLMVVDPPRFVTSTDSKERALKKYYSLNTEALKVVKPNGLLVSCSCSGRVSIEEWVRLLSSVARRSRRFLQILELRGAGRDHPINPHCSETQYLKCVIAHVS